MNDNEIEKIILEKGLNAPRLNPEYIKSLEVSADYYVFPNSTKTICNVTLKNGFTVSGESACASPENFDEDLGRKIAHDNAMNRVWELEGYLLKQRLYEHDMLVMNGLCDL